MKKPVFVLLLVVALTWWVSNLCPLTATAAEKVLLKGAVTDNSGKAVEGAKIFLYNGPDVRRPADFISVSTDKDGKFHVVLPVGKFWAVARLKKSEEYGPLMPGDKHSGEPREIEVVPGRELEMDFTVKDLKDAVSLRKGTREGFVQIKGRVLDKNGMPVPMAYAIAHRSEKVEGLPDYLSSWTDADGSYTLFLPPGKYYLGYALTFPPAQDYGPGKAVFIDTDKTDMDIVISAVSSQ
ncbi:MAG: carboxypeptidase-like regulatory domain-containing protein [Thermodesulfovibrionales bacterium]